MPGSTDLNCEIAPCWKFVWNVDPAALIVPLTELVDDELPELLPEPVEGVDEELDELDEEHAATDRAIATTAPPIAVTCFLPRGCIWTSLLVGFGFSPRRTARTTDSRTRKSEYSLAADGIHT